MAEIVERRKPVRAIARDTVGYLFRHENATLAIVLIAITGGLAVLSRGLTISRTNLSNILVASSIMGIASVGQTFVILTAGIDLSIGGSAVMSSLLGAALITGFRGFPQLAVGVAIVIMLLFAAGVGAINGLGVTRIGMPPLILTLGMWQILGGSALLTTQGLVIYGLPESIAFFGQGHIAGVPVPIIIFIAVCVIAYFVLYHTSFGRSVYAVGGNQIGAWLSGIKVRNILLSVYVICGFLAGLAGLMSIGRTTTAGIRTAAGLELQSIAAACIGGISLSGGRGTLIGVIIGVMILGVIRNGVNVFAVYPAYDRIIMGAVIVSAVAIDCIRKGQRMLS